MGGAAGAAAAAGLFAALPDANAVSPRRKGRLDDVEHVVILMQENRSVDHYYGTMRGVRGFGDRAALRGVFRHPDPARPDGGFLLPWHVDTSTVDGQDLGGHDHTWGGVHAQWDGGNLDGWIANTGEGALTYFTRDDVPFQQALAAASRSVTTISARSRARPLRTGYSCGRAQSTPRAGLVARRSSTRTTTSRSTTGPPTRSGCSRPASHGRCTPTTRSETAAARTGGSATSATTRCAVPGRPRRARLS
jgi:hypothetical protein